MIEKYTKNSVNIKNLELEKGVTSEDLVIMVETNEKSLTAFVFSCEQLSPAFKYSIVFSAAILVFVYLLIMFELVHR